MKKNFATVLLFTFFSASGQKTEPLIAKVYYTFTHQYSKEDTSQKLETNVILLIGKDNSRYSNARYSYTAPRPDLPAAGGSDASARPLITVSATPIVSIVSQLIGNELLYTTPDALSYLNTLGVSSFMYSIPKPKINWDIQNETREIAGFQCQKATGTVAGRTYSVWFTPELAFPYGPWKLSGLPGLILEAADEEEQVTFRFKEFVKAENEFLYYDHDRAVEITEKKYLESKKRFYTDPVNMFKAQLKTGQEVKNIRFYGANGITLKNEEALEAIQADSKIRITNPLELR